MKITIDLTYDVPLSALRSFADNCGGVLRQVAPGHYKIVEPARQIGLPHHRTIFPVRTIERAPANN